MKGDLATDVLKGVSRSFYLTLRLLPGPMRHGASLGYLLARTSDTITDTTLVPVADRLALLDAYGAAVAGTGTTPAWPSHLLAAAEPKEIVLLERSAEVLAALDQTPEAEKALIREVLEIIVSGQRLDLERFSAATPAEPVSLPDDDTVEDYAWRVAGCVGAFWTKLGFLTLGERYSTAPMEELLEKGISYGKGLQLVNILRDLPRDLAAGRCYLPVDEPWDRKALLECHARWVEKAQAWVGEGRHYARTLPIRRLRAATVLPALLAEETLAKLQGARWADLERRVKVPRKRVYALLWKAFLRN
ncbi:squalene/phytoene synthase family protein [Luteolibacter ambystomatis]|uniref:Squalene/phytoene synthase family protein n=1 Tax=Luteolibacter ambystomatis TaxID=2824561 RepID=A0A975IXZ4_9BACT|nr:squalene/phytoene synthase family protein [Luteolibacter ambystomatis]QUE49697.1 squalene/phytoene synthase family protein [Luteolibacter ambystomatis]